MYIVIYSDMCLYSNVFNIIYIILFCILLIIVVLPVGAPGCFMTLECPRRGC